MLDATRRSPVLQREDDDQTERGVHCRVCERIVARTSDRVVIAAGDLHTFVNPQGQVFELVCYAQADGAAAVGEPTLAYTWFPDHAWRVALCRSCMAQLGWRFDGPSSFWGLNRAALAWS